MSTFLREVQPANAFMPISADLGITILSRDVQPANAFLPIAVTEFGIFILSR